MERDIKRILFWILMPVAVAILGLVGVVGCCFGLVFWKPDETLAEVQCGDATLELVARPHPRGGIGDFEYPVFAVYAGESTVEVVVDAGETPHHLPERDRRLGRWHGAGPEYVHFFLDPAVVDDRTARAFEECGEAHGEELVRGMAGTHIPMSGGTRAAGRGRVYWRAPRERLKVTFSDGARTLVVERDGVIRYVENYDNEQGRIDMVDGRPTIFCCYEGSMIQGAELARFVDPEGRTPMEYFAAPLEPRPRYVPR